MAPKKFWILSILLCAAHLLIVFAVISRLGSVDKYGLTIALYVLLGFVFTEFVVVSGIVAVFALIPYKQKVYIAKFRVLFLSAVTFLLFGFSVMLALSFYFGTEIRSNERFADIAIPPHVNCAVVRDGKFETDRLLIERKGSKQVETNKWWGSEKEYTVEWASDCEYILTPVDDSEAKVRVKIVEVTSEGYSCYPMLEEHSDWPASLYTFTRVE